MAEEALSARAEWRKAREKNLGLHYAAIRKCNLEMSKIAKIVDKGPIESSLFRAMSITMMSAQTELLCCLLQESILANSFLNNLDNRLQGIESATGSLESTAFEYWREHSLLGDD